MQIERRSFQTEIRSHEDGDKRTIVGHAAVFNTLSEDLGGFREKIAPGAFKKAIEKDDVRALLNHDPNIILGRNTAGTLRLKEDKKGLAIELDPPDTAAGRDLMVSMERGDITQMSFGFRTIVQEWDESDQNNVVRTLREVDLFDVSPVVFPAYPETDVALREYRAWRELNKPGIWKEPIRRREVDLICSTEPVNAGGWRQDAAGNWFRHNLAQWAWPLPRGFDAELKSRGMEIILPRI